MSVQSTSVRKNVEQESLLARVSVVIVTYNSAAFINRCLTPLGHRPHCQIIVVDNASQDDVLEIVERDYPWVERLALNQNVGFSRGNNAGFELCRNELVLLLNPDAFVETTDTIVALAQFLADNADIAVVGPQLINEDGSHQIGDCGWATNLASTIGYAILGQRWFSRIPSYHLSNKRLLTRNVVDVDWICGACMMTRKSVLEEIGGLDERIFMYGEDVEWGERARAAGWRAAYLPRLKVTHLQGATQKAAGETFYSTKWIDSRAEKIRATRSRWTYSSFKLLLLLGFGLRFVLHFFRSLRNPGNSADASTMHRYFEYVRRL